MKTHVTSYGIIPIYEDSVGQHLYLLLESHGGYWSFPKGHPEPNESEVETASREAEEEVGLKVPIEELKFSVTYGYDEKRSDDVIKSKTVILYPIMVNQINVVLQAKELKSYRWATSEEVVQSIDLPGVEEMMQKVVQWLTIKE